MWTQQQSIGRWTEWKEWKKEQKKKKNPQTEQIKDEVFGLQLLFAMRNGGKTE